MPEGDFAGSWRIEEMELWAQDVLGLDGPAFIEFTEDRLGKLGFVAVHGEIDCNYGERDGHPLVEFSWDGVDDGRPVSGRGWAMLQQAGRLVGRIYIHRGDNSAFVATRQLEKPVGRPRRARRMGSR